MGREQGADYYDEQLERVMRPLEESPWLPVYEAAVSLLPPPESDPALADLGCGTGRFARMLRNTGYTDYWGVDFSPARIAEARRYVPGWRFEVHDLFSDEVKDALPGRDTVVVLEVLEHLSDDVGLLASLPSGAVVVFSVPTYDSAAHVRTFGNPGAAESRYSGILQIDDAPIVIEKPRERKIFVFRSRKR